MRRKPEPPEEEEKETLKKIGLSLNLVVMALPRLVTPLPAQSAPLPSAGSSWEAQGTLFEACSCSVPCPCNFGQAPSRNYCHTVYAYRLKTAHYEGVKLDGLVFGGGEGANGAMGFLDSRATETQRPALEKLALAVFGKGGAAAGNRKFVHVPIETENNPDHFRIHFGPSGGFGANVLRGRDGKNPIVVENNTTWPVQRFIKGKTTEFDYKDALGNQLHFDGVNANTGEFHLSGLSGAK